MNERCAIHLDRSAEITCARCGNYACYECVGPSDSGICARCRMKTGGDRVGQVRLLAILTIINGTLLTLFGGLYTLIAPVFAFMPRELDRNSEIGSNMMVAFSACFGLINLAPGVLQILAGVRMLKMRGRTFALCAYAAGFLTFCGIYCAPTSLAVGIYGAILLFDRDVRAAFDRQDVG